MNVLVTGAGGFAGGHLMTHLAARKGLRVFGAVHADGDLRKPSAAARVIRRSRPARIFHLAGISSGAAAWRDPGAAFAVNAMGTWNLLESVRLLGLRPRVLIASSAEVYGAVPKAHQPAGEDQPVNPISPYGLSKAAGELAARRFLAMGFGVVIARAFNHTGPGQRPAFAASSFARQIALIEAGRHEPVLGVGNLDAVRDYTDARDVVRAYALVLDKAEPGFVYNICSGRGLRIGQVLEILLSLSGARVRVRRDRALFRPADIPAQVGSPARIRALGWRPEIPLKKSLKDLLDYWRENI
ncbi:MAG: hypothetical protein A3C53_08625 [Omnitrophica WOR_2 bacterium RIFCSPHIGHO2_02_FULL_68_15]|nr:MAG: hypothetical protein A3C53_08625 [Omnitrophica WOR_2 bacterium RIFCSPHIGHO2_02_FULL_68_15]